MEEGTGDSEDEGEEIQEDEQLDDMLDQVEMLYFNMLKQSC